MGLEGDEDAVTDVVEDLAPVRLLASGDVDETAAGHASAIRRRPEDPGEVVQAGRREGEASSGQSSPVPLATAAISIAALVPSVNELYIFGLKSPFATSSSLQPKKLQTVSGVE